MNSYTITFLPGGEWVRVEAGTTLLQAMIRAGLHPNAPCGGKGICGKCLVTLADGSRVPACQTPVSSDLTVTVPQGDRARILTRSLRTETRPDGDNAYVLAVDVGTTTLVAYLLDGVTGETLAQASCLNPQGQYGADVISRIQYVMQTGPESMARCVRDALAGLTRQAAGNAGIDPQAIGAAALVGNTAMHHLALGIDPKPLTTPPYMPRVRQAMELPGGELLPIGGTVRVLPNIAGFVGADTVGCMTTTRFDRLEELSLLIDIGTNGEMVLGNAQGRTACSTAAGPAFEGAKISCGMRGADGAVDHVYLRDGRIEYHVIGGGQAKGLCGSGLLDLVAVLLDLGYISESGRLKDKAFQLCPAVTLTQKDVREVQLAKSAIRTGIELLAQTRGVPVSRIEAVYLAGAFGNYLTPASACRIGMIPPVLEDRIRPIGNAAGEGAKLCALSRAEFAYSQELAQHTQFLELACLPRFQDMFVDCLNFEEEEP